MKFDIPKIQCEYPLTWIPDVFEIDPVAIIQLLSLRGWKDQIEPFGIEIRSQLTEPAVTIDGKCQINQMSNVPHNAKQLNSFIKTAIEITPKIAGQDGDVKIAGMWFEKFTDGDYFAETDLPALTKISLFLSPNWIYGWGGITEVSRDSIWGPVASPKAGSILLSKEHTKTWMYRCSPVEPTAPVPRLSLEILFSKKRLKNMKDST